LSPARGVDEVKAVGELLLKGGGGRRLGKRFISQRPFRKFLNMEGGKDLQNGDKNWVNELYTHKQGNCAFKKK